MRRREFLGSRVRGWPVRLWPRYSAAEALAQAQGWPERTVKLILPYAPGGATDAHRPPLGRQAQPGLRPAVRGREPRRRERHDRRRGRRQVGARRLHASCSRRTRRSRCCRSCARRPTIRSRASIRSGASATSSTASSSTPRSASRPSRRWSTTPRRTPASSTFGSSGNGTSTHLRLEMLKYKAGIDILHVPYRGGADTLNDVLPGNVQMMNEPVSLPHVKAGKLILLNINARDRHPRLPRRADADRARHHRRRRADLVLHLRAGRNAEGASSPSSTPRCSRSPRPTT